MSQNALKITRKENFSDWYQEVISEAELADNAVIRGCMVMRPYSYAIWENIQKILDKKIKEVGVQNAYFPLLIPLEFLEREAEHVNGFAKECAVVTHHRLVEKNGKLVPDSELESPYIIRPTSETIIGESFSKWVKSYRDLPLKINQWANVMRWEMRTRLFLRTSEFLWQEGHCVFETLEEAEQDTMQALDIYNDLMQNYLAIYGIKGKKTEDEKFPGAVNTYTIESMMQDGKSLQSCTTHNLGQNFTKSSNIKFSNKEETEQYAYSSSWGISTRIIGALIMSHSDDDGLVLPPNIAPYQIVIIPVIHDDSKTNDILNYCKKIKESLGNETSVFIDNSNKKASDKKWQWIKKGAPIRLEIGTREVDENKIFYVTRDKLMEKNTVSFDEFLSKYKGILENMQKNLFEENKKRVESNIFEIDKIQDLKDLFRKNTCFALIDKKLWKNEELEKIMQDNALSYRCMPFEKEGKVIIGKSY